MGDGYLGIALEYGLEHDCQYLVQVFCLSKAILDGFRRFLDCLAHISGKILLDLSKSLPQLVYLRV